MIRCAFQSPRAQKPQSEAPYHQWETPAGRSWANFFRLADGYLVRFPELADFRIEPSSDSVTCTPVEGVEEATVQHLFLNQVLPLAMSIRGHTVFHASAVEVGNQAIAFLGNSGRGKSTLAASFASGGYRFLSDDALILQRAVDGAFDVQPAHPSLRLWDDSRDAITPRRTKKALEAPFKTRLAAGQPFMFCDQPRPLVRAYVLGDADVQAPRVRALAPAEALVTWVRHSFLLDPRQQSMLASNLEGLAQLVNTVSMFLLDHPRNFASLPRLRERLAAHEFEIAEASIS